MTSYVSLTDITTTPKSNDVETYHAVGDGDMLDEIEYCLGMERGDIEQYKDTELLRVELHSDMVTLLKDAQCALVPSGVALQSMLDLFDGNHRNGPSNRTLFTVAIPPQTPFEYRFMGLKQGKGKGKLVYANGKKYAFPFTRFPIVRSNLHPCFLLPSLVRCMNIGLLAGRKHLTALGTNQGLVSSAYLILKRFFHVSWLGNTHAADFPNRRIPMVRTYSLSTPDEGEGDAERVIEATPPPSPEMTNVRHLSPQPDPSEHARSPPEEHTPENASSPEPPEAPRAGASKRKRKTAPASSDDSNPPPARRRSPRFTSS